MAATSSSGNLAEAGTPAEALSSAEGPEGKGVEVTGVSLADDSELG